MIERAKARDARQRDRSVNQMKTVVQFHRTARVGLLRWLDSIVGPELQAAFMREMYAAEIRSELVNSRGLPYGVLRETGIDPPIYWWEFLPKVWIQYCIKTEGWFRKRRRVIVVGIWEEPPSTLRR